MIQVKSVTKRCHPFTLSGIDFEIPAGYICGLAGQNGAGKTTLLHLLLGLYQPDEGKILIDHMDYASNEKQIHDCTGVVLVDELFDASSTILQNAGRYGKYFSQYDRGRMESYLERFHLDKNKKFGRLSKGEKLKCQFAFALSHNAKLLVLDEPTANFDPDFRQQFLQLLKEFISDGTRSVILSTHLTEDLDSLADYLVYLEKGRQVFAGDIECFRESYRIVDGEKYKINLLPKEHILHMEERAYGTSALVLHSRRNRYDKTLTVRQPSIQEFMYYYAKRGGKSI